VHQKYVDLAITVRCRRIAEPTFVAEDAAATGEPVFGAAAADDRRGELGLVQRSSSAPPRGRFQENRVGQHHKGV